MLPQRHCNFHKLLVCSIVFMLIFFVKVFVSTNKGILIKFEFLNGREQVK